MAELSSLTASEVREGYLAKKFGVEEYLESVLARISETTELNAFITVVDSEPLKSLAKKAQVRIDSEKENSPFFTGIPVAIKDQIVTKGIKTTCGSKILHNFKVNYKIKQNQTIYLI